ncbi:ClpP/crotonase [Choiromyces venosus 120613-1]|uniref:ClpP/crotonase n=1 Tax=Choiromyces venosus 120613-1 TaxID=1336337 RepID=A0A3N4JQZ7_9PEZI|nr:ClpP/crotonase [Choiromyces venosus 120613-1]
MSQTYKHFNITFPVPFVAHVEINRPEKLNAFFQEMWLEYAQVFNTLSHSLDVRCIILSGAGPTFTAGLDIRKASLNFSGSDGARKAWEIKRYMGEFQDCISASEKCEKPVICVLHGYSLGLAIDIACTADIRISSVDAKLAVKEVDIGLAADIGTLSRLPKIVGSLSWVKDVTLSARIFSAEEALRVGFVSTVESDKEAAVRKAVEMAGLIAAKSPVAVQGTKAIVNWSVDRTVADGLAYTQVWNAAALQTGDVREAVGATLEKRKPRFEKL